MADDKPAVRLSKATKDLNIGIDHIVEFLNSKGFKVDKNPNAKISSDAFYMLQQEFQPDMLAKQDALEITREKQRRENIIIEAKDTTSPATAKEAEPDSDEDLQKSLLSIKQKASETATKQKNKKEKEPEVKAKPEVFKAKASKIEAPKVIDKIDLESLEKPKKSSRKKAEEEPKEKVTTKKKESKEKPVAKEKTEKPAKGKKKKEEVEEEEIVTVSEKTEPQPEPVAPVEIIPETPVEEPPKTEDESTELYRTKRSKLSGPTILGKIDLPVDPPKKKPVASSSPDDSFRKKKRKRKDKKVNIEAAGKTVVDKPQERNFRPGDGRGGYRGGQQRRGRPEPKPEVTDKEIQDQIKATLARLSGGGKSKGSKLRKLKREQAAAEQEAIAEEATKKVIKVTEFVSANELARMMEMPVTEIISACMSLGLFVSINQRLDAETISVVAEEFGYQVEFVSVEVQEAIQDKEDTEEELQPRAPIVTVMGHVDHGKTSLLDYIRKTNVIAGEAGGITQHIGAYEVTLENGKKISFLDTPGHEAFTAMRARGAKVTDVAIIVVAADDSVMPQTVEAINHASAANVPIVFAINKVDKAGANPERIREQLAKMNYLVEDWGGKYQCQEISAKQGLNIDLLLEKVLLQADLLELKANPKRLAKGGVIESSLDKGRGYVATILVQNGTLHIGDVVLAGCYSGRVKAMFNERGGKMEEAGPSTPTLILGLNGAPQAGDQFNVMEDEREARDIANKRLQLQREQGIRTHKHITLDEIGRRLAIGNFKELNIIVKGDVDGSIEALSDSLLKLSTSEIQVNIIHKSVGAITESDVLLATASEAIIVGFQVRPTLNARRLAENEQIEIRLYSIIYDAINEIKSAMEGMLAPEYEEKIVCNIEVRETFKIPKVGTVAGCMVLDGKINRNTSIRIIREGIVAYTGKLASLKRFKDDVKEVSAGFECGLNIENFNDIKVGDIIEGYEQVAVKRTLA